MENMPTPQNEPVTNGSSALAKTDASAETLAALPQAQTAISADEIALYDRQIRLWGVQAQEKLRTAHVLLVNLSAVANEIAKNLVLAGIGAITLLDRAAVSDQDLGAQFLIAEEDVGRNRAEAAAVRLQKLNPRVAVHVDTADVRSKTPDFFSPYAVIIATCLDIETLLQINEHARRTNRPFYASDSHGFYGYIFSDLVSHDYVIERERSNVPTALKAESATRSVVDVSTKRDNGGKVIEMVTKRERYCTLAQASSAPLPSEYHRVRRRLRQVPPLLTGIQALWAFHRARDGATPRSNAHDDVELFTRLATEEHRRLRLPPETLASEFLTTFLQNVGGELAPVTAFLGGQLAQDVINVLGQREQPIQNLLLFDALETKAPVFALYPDPSSPSSPSPPSRTENGNV